MFKAIHASENLDAAREKGAAVVNRLRELKLAKAAELLEAGLEETLLYIKYPHEPWRNLRTNHPMERLIKEIRRRTRAAEPSPMVIGPHA